MRKLSLIFFVVILLTDGVHFGAVSLWGEFSQIYKAGTLESLHGFDHNFTQNAPAVNKKIAAYLAE